MPMPQMVASEPPVITASARPSTSWSYAQPMACRAEAQALVQKLFGGSRQALFSALVQQQALSADEVRALQEMIEKG